MSELTPLPGLADGVYQAYAAVDPKDLRKVPRRMRASCLEPGYRYWVKDDRSGPGGRLIVPIYCPIDGNKVLRPQDVAWLQGIGYRLADRGIAQSQHLSGDVFLWQEEKQRGEPGFEYMLARPVAGGFDMTLLTCLDFPTIYPRPANAEPNDAAADPTTSSKEHPADIVAGPVERSVTLKAGVAYGLTSMSECYATSIAAIRPELDAVVKRLAAGDEPVAVLFRRVATAGAVSGSPPR